jgi:hypothetical protein
MGRIYHLAQRAFGIRSEPFIIERIGMVRLAGLEPATQGLGIPCSILTELQAHQEFIVYLIYLV